MSRTEPPWKPDAENTARPAAMIRRRLGFSPFLLRIAMSKRLAQKILKTYLALGRFLAYGSQQAAPSRGARTRKEPPKVRKTKKAVYGAAAAASLALALTACTAGASSSGGGTSSGGATGSGNSGGTLTLGLLVPATTFEAPDMNWANESPYAQAVYDTLVQASPSGAIEPDLATAWSYNADKTVLTLTLRTGIKFTDGTAFDATTAAANLEAFQKGTSNNASDLVNMASASAASPTKLVITLKQPDPAFLVYLTQNAGLQESPKAFTSSTAKTTPVG